MTDRILITGGSDGIGQAIVRNSIQNGYDPVVLDRQESPDAPTILADLSDSAATADALNKALLGGPITRVVNNVGAVFPATAEDQTLAEFENAFALNLRTAFQVTQALIPSMKAAGFGRIVNMSSRAALGKDLRSAYSATKAGLIGLTRVWALELGTYGITANAIGPGPIATKLFNDANPAGHPRTEKIIQSVPVKRVGTPNDVANAAEFFLKTESGFITGQMLYVCGGLTVGLAAL